MEGWYVWHIVIRPTVREVVGKRFIVAQDLNLQVSRKRYKIKTISSSLESRVNTENTPPSFSDNVRYPS